MAPPAVGHRVNTRPPAGAPAAQLCLHHCAKHATAARRFLIATAAQPAHWMFLHKLIWALETEERPGDSEFSPDVKRSGWAPPVDTGLWAPCAEVKAAVLARLPPAARAYFDDEHGTFEKVRWSFSSPR